VSSNNAIIMVVIFVVAEGLYVVVVCIQKNKESIILHNFTTHTYIGG
jgi:hypothetical protein